MAVTIEFTPCRSDLLRAGYVALRARPKVLAAALGLFVVLPWAAAVLALAGRISGLPISWWSIGTLVLIPPLVVVAFSSVALNQVRGARTLRGKHTYLFTNTGIRLTGPGFDNSVQWHALTRCYGCSMGLMFYSGNAPCISVPGRMLTPAVAAELQQIASAAGLTLAGPWRRQSVVRGTT
jgi:hypothetical protein